MTIGLYRRVPTKTVPIGLEVSRPTVRCIPSCSISTGILLESTGLLCPLLYSTLLVLINCSTADYVTVLYVG